MKWLPQMERELSHLWNVEKLSATKIARKMGLSRGAILGKSIRLNLHFRKGRAVTLTDFHDAVIEGRTLFPSQRRTPGPLKVLKTAAWQRKVGGMIKKGKWAGMPVYALTLEERATCPRSCIQWNGCYGNGMQRASRQEHGPMLEATILTELNELQQRHPKGFVVRLHILGDFYSMQYVEMWADALAEFPALHVFGYTAWPMESDIGGLIAEMRESQWRRFAIRTSGVPSGIRANVYTAAKDVPGNEIICPAQLNKTASCATCALCWGSQRPIAFLKH